MNKTIITVAVCGSVPTKEMNPAVPYTPKEIADSAIDSYKAGATIAHIHVRDPETGVPISDISLFSEVVDRIRNSCDMIINLTTSGINLKGENLIEQRLEPVKLLPEICSFDIGSMNFQHRPFINSPEWGRLAAKRMREYGIKPEIEVFDMGHIRQAKHWLKEGLIDDPPYFQLCMGAGWGIEATPENLLVMKNALPPSVIWSVLGVGRMQLPMITMAMLSGGHVRVGFEDNIYLRRGELLKSNAQIVEVAANIIQQLQGEVANTNEAREILGLLKSIKETPLL
ncbi:3-keto-5-aminohexanoate cleavage protein [Candidatus Poribacteria bacterium]|nr:3-keto-5-aminohexanoate cleavage protein [Candidatus Poribacteria bacterium]